MSAIDEVKSRVDIVDLIGESISLQKAGRNFKALCPFHNEKTPSFHVSPERQTWHCFGACGTGGDIFSFVMKQQEMEFGEALRLLADRGGVTLPDRRDAKATERDDRLLQANEGAAAFFHNALVHSDGGGAAREYLNERGLDGATIEAFQLGMSPDSWDALRTHLLERGFSPDELLAAGLLVESERGGYDRFRGRLMFPIRDQRGRVVGFGARAMATEGQETTDAPGAKYINTPQTSLFDKSGILYALDLAKDTIRKEKTVIVVEGYMDVIAAHQHGITNVIASMGTALTERQIRQLERFRSKILLAMDSDSAGIEATLRALQEAGSAGAIRASSTSVHPAELGDEEFSSKAVEWTRDALKRASVNFFVIPLLGKDPDEMIRADREAWDAAVASAKPFTDHIFDTVAERKDLSKPDERSELMKELVPVVRLIDEPVFRAHYEQRLARLAQVDEDVVRAELRRPPARRARPTDQSRSAPASPARREPAEEFLLALLLRHPELRPQGQEISSNVFLLSEHRAVYNAWLETSELESIRAAITEDIEPQLDRVLARDLPSLEGPELRAALEDCVRRIEWRRLSAAKRASTAALTEPTVQPYMSAAVEEAITLQDTDITTQHPAPSAGDAKMLELAASLVEDQEMGRRLHNAAGMNASQQPDPAPESESA